MKVPQLSSHVVRAYNDRAFLDLLAEHGPLTRAELATASRLSRPYVVEVTDRLVADGVVTNHGRRESAGRGRKAQLFGLPPDLGMCIGVDIAFDEIRIRRRRLGSSHRDDTVRPIRPGHDLVPQVVEALAGSEPVQRSRHRTVVVALPGVVDPRTGDIVFASGRPEWTPGTADRLRSELGGQVIFDNEANLQAVAEADGGAAAGLDDFVLLALGAGVGAAIMIDGRVRTGAHGAAGEVGYLPVDGAPVPLGRRSEVVGGYQDLAGARALAASIGLEHDDSWSWTVDLLARPADSPEWREIARRVGIGVLAQVSVIDPGCIVLAGETVRMIGPALVQPLRTMLAEHLPWPVELRVSRSGDEAVLAGAVRRAESLLRDHVFGSPDLRTGPAVPPRTGDAAG